MMAYGFLRRVKTVSSEKIFQASTMLSNNGGNDSWDTVESSTQHFNTQVVVLMLLLVTSTSYAGCVCVGVCAHEYLPGFYRGIGGHTHLGCFSLTVINHQRVT